MPLRVVREAIADYLSRHAGSSGDHTSDHAALLFAVLDDDVDAGARRCVRSASG